MTTYSNNDSQSNDPDSLISVLRIYLNEYGCIKSLDDISNILSLMESATSIVSRTIFINIINSTCISSLNFECHQKVLKRFLEIGGWVLFNKWFEELFNSKQLILLNQFIEMLKNLPVTTDLLKQGCIAKSLKKVSKLDYKPLQLSSRKLLFTWKVVVKKETDTNSKPENSSKISNINKNTQTALSGNSFLQSLSAAVCSNESSRKRKISTEYQTPKETIATKTDVTTIPEQEIIQETPQPIANVEVTENEIKAEELEIAVTPRRVRFKDDSELVDIFYFEMTDQERLEMHGHHDLVNFTEAAHQELLEEKKALQTAKSMVEDKEPIRDWIKPEIIEDIITRVPPGSCSTESAIQSTRESGILANLFIEKSQTTALPFEPDLPDDCKYEKNFNINIDLLEHEAKIPLKPYWENYAFPAPIPRRLFHTSSKRAMDSNIFRRGAYQQPYRSQKYINTRPPNSNTRDVYNNYAPGRGRSFRGRGEFNSNNYEAPRMRNDERVYVPNYENESYQTTTATTYRQPPNQAPIQNIQYNPNNNGIVCRHFLKGKCKLGSNCRFKHEAN